MVDVCVAVVVDDNTVLVDVAKATVVTVPIVSVVVIMVVAV